MQIYTLSPVELEEQLGPGSLEVQTRKVEKRHARVTNDAVTNKEGYVKNRILHMSFGEWNPKIEKLNEAIALKRPRKPKMSPKKKVCPKTVSL